MFPKYEFLPAFSRAYRFALCVSMGYLVVHSLMVSILDDEDLPIYIQILKLHNIMPLILAINYGFGVLCADKQPHEMYNQHNIDEGPSSSLVD